MAKYHKEKVAAALQENPNMENSVREYFQAILEDRLPKYYLDLFKRLKGDYSDELPDKPIWMLDQDWRIATGTWSGASKFDFYKCRGDYICKVSGNLKSAVDDGVIEESGLIQKIENFRVYDFRYRHREFTTPGEIALINSVLEDMIGYLEPRAAAAEQKKD